MKNVNGKQERTKEILLQELKGVVGDKFDEYYLTFKKNYDSEEIKKMFKSIHEVVAAKLEAIFLMNYNNDGLEVYVEVAYPKLSHVLILSKEFVLYRGAFTSLKFSNEEEIKEYLWKVFSTVAFKLWDESIGVVPTEVKKYA